MFLPPDTLDEQFGDNLFPPFADSLKMPKSAQIMQTFSMDISDGCGIMKEDMAENQPRDEEGQFATTGASGSKSCKASAAKSSPQVDAFRNEIASEKANLSIRTQKQNAHRVGIRQYDDYAARRKKAGKTPPSRVLPTISDQELFDCVRDKLGSSTLEAEVGGGFQEFIDCDRPVGEDYDTKKKKFVPTKRVQVKYSKNGIHIIPVKEI